MKKIIYIALCIIGGGMLGTSCSEPDELTPRVESVTSSYLIPSGTILTAEDREEVEELWKEYNEAINQ
jgi:hypothetical protein